MDVRLEAFEGPFDLLFHLIEKNEIDIYDIPIAKLAQQYLEYLEQSNMDDMEDMSEFLVMAATLLEIKSKYLLPNPKAKEDEEGDPRAELVARLLEYKKYKGVTTALQSRAEQAALMLYKETGEGILKLAETEEPQELSEFLQGVTLQDVYQAFEEVMRRRETKVDHVRSSFRYVERDLYTVQEKQQYIRDLLIISPKTTFHSIFRKDARKIEVVVTFLALLELIKLKEIIITQKAAFADILIMKYDGRDNNEINGN